MTTDLVRRQVLRTVGRLGLTSVSGSLPAHGKNSTFFQCSLHHVQRDLLAATKEDSLLQIDPGDLRDTLKLCGSSPLSFTVTNHDADKVLNACRDALARITTHKKAAAVVVCSGYGKSFQLSHCAEVFRVVRRAMDESTCLALGVVFDPQLVNAMSVTWLVGAPDG